MVDKHPEWLERKDSARMAYVVSLQCIIAASASLLSLVAPAVPAIWRGVFMLLGLVGVAGAVLVSRSLAGSQGSLSVAVLLVSLPVYVGVIVVALVLVLGLHAVWFFTHHAEFEPEDHRLSVTDA